MRLGDLVQVLHVPDLRAGKFVDDEIFLVVVPAIGKEKCQSFVTCMRDWEGYRGVTS
jgi:acetolactate synthase small subunit